MVIKHKSEKSCVLLGVVTCVLNQEHEGRAVWCPESGAEASAESLNALCEQLRDENFQGRVSIVLADGQAEIRWS